MSAGDRPAVWLHGEIKTPPFSKEAQVEAGTLLRRLQDGEMPGLPHARAMPSIGAKCHELRVRDENHNWRIIYRLDEDVIAEVFARRTHQTPRPGGMPGYGRGTESARALTSAPCGQFQG
jgi:phage-related protein